MYTAMRAAPTLDGKRTIAHDTFRLAFFAIGLKKDQICCSGDSCDDSYGKLSCLVVPLTICST